MLFSMIPLASEALLVHPSDCVRSALRASGNRRAYRRLPRILNAINNAVGVRIISLPAAAEKVFAATHPFYTLATHLTCTRLRRLCVRLGPASW